MFMKENLTFTGEDSPMANLLLSVMGAFAEFERALIHERQREGIALAKGRGAYRGRNRWLRCGIGQEQASKKRRSPVNSTSAARHFIKRDRPFLDSSHKIALLPFISISKVD